MRFKKVLLISPPTSSYLGAARPPQNLGYLAASLKQNNIDYHVLDMRLGHSQKDLYKTIALTKPDLIGVTMVSLEYKKTYDFIEKIKQKFPEIKIGVGGPHVTVMVETVLQDCTAIDFGVVNEGEEVLVDLCQSKEAIQEIKGLIFRQNGEIVYNGNRPVTVDLDHLPFPAYEGFELEKYIDELPLNSSRGCPLKCIFCPNKMITKKFRFRSAIHVVEEIEFWYKKGYRVFNFDDDNFTLLNDRVYTICDELEKRGIIDAEFRCSNGIRADRVDRALLKRMKEVGFHYIAFGIDGGNNKMLKHNRKGESIEQIDEAVKIACELGYDVKIFVITGMPHETMEDIEDSIKFVEKYPIKRVILNNPIPYPGTELFDIISERGWFVKSPEEYLNHVTENENIPVFTTPELNFDDRVQILRRIRKVEKAVTRNAVKRMYSKYYFAGTLLAMIFATDWAQRMFFMNMRFRRFVESIRHRRMLLSARTKLEG